MILSNKVGKQYSFYVWYEKLWYYKNWPQINDFLLILHENICKYAFVMPPSPTPPKKHYSR